MHRKHIVNTNCDIQISSRDWEKGNIAICCAEYEEIPKGINWEEGIEACSRGSCRIIETPQGGIAVLCITGVGKESAAAAVQHLLDIHGIKVIINVGFCGGLNKHVNLDQLLLITKATYYDGSFLWENLDSDPSVDAPWVSPAREVIALAKESAKSVGISLREAAIITADRPLHNSVTASILAEKFRADAVDMEAATVASVCNKHRNVEWLVIKVQCDNADEYAYTDHNNARTLGVSAMMTTFLIALIEKLYSPPVNPRNLALLEGIESDCEDELLRRNAKSVWNPFSMQICKEKDLPKVIVRARGVRIWDAKGRCYFDGTSGTKNVILGHAHPALSPFIVDQMHRLEHWPADDFTSVPLINFSDALLSHLPEEFGYVFTNTGGSEAVETAIRISREYHRCRNQNGRYKVLSLHGSYHGSTLGAISLTGHAPSRIHSGPLLEGILFVNPPTSENDEDLEAAFQEIERVVELGDPSTFSCFIFEPVLGLGGIKPLPTLFIKSLCQLATDIGALVVVDEVASGLGRTGRWFEFERAQIRPDIITCGKALTNGTIPLSAAIISHNIFQVIYENSGGFVHGHTYSGHPLGAAAGIRVLTLMDQMNIIDRVNKLSSSLNEIISQIVRMPIVKEVRHAGLWVGIDIQDPVSGQPVDIISLSREITLRGVIHDMLGPTIGLSPALTISVEDLREMMTIMMETIAEWNPQRKK
jgi:adenosylmethionine-8-amino-7-oxononanoate aminotransferase/nucleoside phosphorylase